jgi:predicted DNA-binding transcriptional regulator YafY
MTPKIFIDYTDRNGDREMRVVTPAAVFWHRGEQAWALCAEEAGVRRNFALERIHSFSKFFEPPTPAENDEVVQ